MAEDWRNDPALDAAVDELGRVPEVPMEAPAEATAAQQAAAAPAGLAERLPGMWRTVAERGEWLSTRPGEPAWLLRRDGAGWLRSGIVGMLVGGGGTGKTMAALQLALAVAAAGEGEPGERAPQWFGVDVCGGGGAVLVLLGEEPEEEARRRFWRAAEALKLSEAQRAAAAKRLVVLPLAGEAPALRVGGVGVQREDTALVAALKEHLQKPPACCTGWSLLVVDPLSRFGGPDAEVDNGAATELITTLEALRVAAEGNPTLLVIHHKGKGELREGTASQTGARGASALVDGARWVCDMSRERLPAKKPDEKKGESWSEGEVVAIQSGRRVLLEVVKSNYSLPGPPLRLAVADDGALVRAPYQNQTEALEAAAERASAGKAGVRAMMDSKWLKSAVMPTTVNPLGDD